MIDVAENNKSTSPQDGGYIVEWTHGEDEAPPKTYPVIRGPV